jgi:hypothetical protein
MSDTSDTLATSEPLPEAPAVELDTTSGSILHLFVRLQAVRALPANREPL